MAPKLCIDQTIENATTRRLTRQNPTRAQSFFSSVSSPPIQTEPKDTLASRINIEKYSNYKKLQRVTARILAMYKKDLKPTLKNATRTLTAGDIDNAERFWILELQSSM